mmetsp:Transcript_42740/g.103099  ORF Transcript_42740/g.103099 Transcript_42740/m.103099 type:complete len:433 (+) Transcript_42740:245-1543(+)
MMSNSCGLINIKSATVLVIVAAILFPATATAKEHCNICKYADSPIAYELGNPDAVLATLGEMTMTCEEAQDYAFQLNGLPGLTVEQCEMAQMLAGDGTCGCPNEPPASGASSASIMGRGDNLVCVLCLSGNEPTMNGFIGGLQCLELAFDGLAGDLNTEECFLSQLAADSISNVCGCRIDPTSAPVTAPPPLTPVPTAPPTALPSASPTRRPTPEPTLPPTLRPTPEPTPQPTTSSPTSAPTFRPTSDPTASPTSPPTPVPTAFPTLQPLINCNLCRDGGFDLQNPNGVIALLGQFPGRPYTCAEAQAFVLSGVTNTQCAIAQAAAAAGNVCGCPNFPMMDEPTSAPITLAPVGPPTTPFCPVCINGNRAMGSANIGGFACQFLDDQGRMGQLTGSQCSWYQLLAADANDPCECADPTAPPVAAPVTPPDRL